MFSIEVMQDDCFRSIEHYDDYLWSRFSVHPKERRLSGGSSVYSEMLNHVSELENYRSFNLKGVIRDFNELSELPKYDFAPEIQMVQERIMQLLKYKILVGEDLEFTQDMSIHFPKELLQYNGNSEEYWHQVQLYMKDVETTSQIAEAILEANYDMVGFEYASEVIEEIFQEFINAYPYKWDVSLYDHSGYHLSLGNGSCRWDSTDGAAWIFAENEKYAQGSIDELNDLYSGNIHGFRITYDDKGMEVEVDSCYGFVGDESVAQEAAEENLKGMTYKREVGDYLVKFRGSWTEATWDGDKWLITLLNEIASEEEIEAIREN